MGFVSKAPIEYKHDYVYHYQQGDEDINDIFPGLEVGTYRISQTLLVPNTKTTNMSYRLRLSYGATSSELALMYVLKSEWETGDTFYPIFLERTFTITQEILDAGYSIDLVSTHSNTVRYYSYIQRIS